MELFVGISAYASLYSPHYLAIDLKRSLLQQTDLQGLHNRLQSLIRD